jgi:hypothetical protein
MSKDVKRDKWEKFSFKGEIGIRCALGDHNKEMWKYCDSVHGDFVAGWNV